MRIFIFSVVLFWVSTTTLAGEKEAWDVSSPFGPVTAYSFETDQGTWMSLDVSPDGKWVVFDMLGDIYLLPREGGDAKALTKGLALDLQPRFSPDGRHISFTSDRGGGDNIWIMDLKGENLTQVTDESFRLLNNAAWTPDGQYLIARKHFTSGRSLGAGELWLYHRSGGSGVQLTKRKNDQQDLGEPSVSPDGRYVYYSEDVSPGGAFDYNRDPHSGIYAIKRLNLENGEIETLISGPGGAARPQISPDGNYLAYVKRIEEKTVLHLLDLASGGSRPIYDDMSHDQQEAWAIFGVYPGFAWLPNGKGLVFWAQGKIRQLNLIDGQVETIPFKALVQGEVVSSVRTKPDLDETTAKVIRQAATSPDGKWLVFHAVGNLWKKKLPNGKPERLTQDQGFEYEPAFSADGTQIVYTRWRDQEQGAVMVASLTKAGARQLNLGSGFFFEPSFLPDGKGIVYRKGRGNSLLGNLHARETGLYHFDFATEEKTKISDSGRQPYVSPVDQRAYFLDGFGQNKSYRSVSLSGRDPQTHLNLKYVTDLVPSPDGRCIAFREGFNVFVAAFPKTGSAFDLSKETKSVPVQAITTEVGTTFHWSSQGKKLHWMAGDRYHSADVPTLPLGKDSQLPQALEQGVPVGLEFEVDTPTGSVVFDNVRLITMRGDEVIEKGRLVVVQDRIQALGDATNVAIPKDAKVYDLQGKTIIPGIIDVHGHASHFSSGPSPETNWAYYANLALGVTALHDPSANTETVFGQAELVRAGRMVGPRVFSTGAVLYGADGDNRVVINSFEDSVAHLKRLKANGAFSVKSYNQPRRNQRQMILKAARQENMIVVNEGGSTFVHNLTMLLDGTTGIEHNIPVAPLYKDVISLWAATDVRYTPTLVVSFGGVSGEYYWYQHDNVWEHPLISKYYPPEFLANRSRRRLKLPEAEFYHIDVAKAAKALLDAGVKVQVGGHGQLQGLAAHWEMWMLGQGGFTPLEVLRAATLHGADYIGLSDHLGSLEKGKRADLVVLNANPLENIRNSDKVHAVMVNGRLYDAATMDEIGNHPKKRSSFPWERSTFSLDGFGADEGETHCSCRPGGGSH